MSLIRALALLLLCVPSLAARQDPPASPPPAPPLEAVRLNEMLDNGDSSMIVMLFRRHPNAVLPFIDEFLEAGLAEIEATEKAGTPEDRPQKAVALFRRALRFAALADNAFGGSVFAEYASNFASWNADERKRFREGQRLFRAGRAAAKEDPAAGIPLFEASLALAQPLGDDWGVAMASKALAESLAATEGGTAAALPHARRAQRVYGEIKLTKDHLASLRLVGSLLAAGGDGHLAVSVLGQAWGIVTAPGWTDRSTMAAVGEEHALLLERLGRAPEAKEVRAVVQRSVESTPPSSP